MVGRRKKTPAERAQEMAEIEELARDHDIEILFETNVLADKPAKARNGATLGFETKLWATADALRNNMDAAEYKHVVLGLIFLKYISDAFEAKHEELAAQKALGAEPEDPDEYRAVNIFWVPPEARWTALKAAAPQPTIGTLVDDAMAAI